MKQHGALGRARGAAGILQHGEIVGRDRDRAQAFPARRAHDGRKGDGVGQVVFRNRLFHPARDEIDQRPLGAEQIARRHQHDLFQPQLFMHGGDGRGEIFQHEQKARRGVDDLKLQLARGVERVDVDDHSARLQHADQDCRIGHHVRRHDRDAVALGEAGLLQPRRDPVGRRAQLLVSQARRRNSPAPCGRRRATGCAATGRPGSCGIPARFPRERRRDNGRSRAGRPESPRELPSVSSDCRFSRY